MAQGNPKYPYTYTHLVIVHGIGDQAPNETSLNFMNNLLRALPRGTDYHLDVDSLIESVDPPSPGELHARFEPSYAVFTIDAPVSRNFVIGFSEVFWQDITNGYLDQFGKAPPIPIFVWAHSINTRLLREERMFYTAREAIDNLESILDLVKKLAAIFKRPDQLWNILNRFLGDVQMYAESDVIGGQINQRFADVLGRVPAAAAAVGEKFGQTFDNPEIYIVAHSEGTVVSYSSLVEAAGQQAVWFPMVRALVTMGSPIDKHYTIWKNRFGLNQYSGPARTPKIRWFNYWDVSDPVGYGLKELNPGPGTGTDADKLFTVCYDRGFARYVVPGLAHVGYWDDLAIHEHIIDKVMDIGTTRKDTTVRSRWFEPFQTVADWAAYILARAAGVGAILYFLAKLLGPLKPAQPFDFLETSPTPWRYLNYAIWLAVPLVLCKLLWEVYARNSGILAKIGLGLRWLAWIGWLALLVMAALNFSSPGIPPVKDTIGYATGLVTVFLGWKLHTRVHRGLVQMWRYTKGTDTGAEKAPTAPP